jgi:hypothetical protein
VSRGFSDNSRKTALPYIEEAGRRSARGPLRHLSDMPTYQPVLNLWSPIAAVNAKEAKCYAYQMRDLIRIVPLVVVAFVTAAQTQPDVASILNRVSQTYKAVSDYELIADITMRKGGARPNSSGHVLFAFRHPNQYRMESANAWYGAKRRFP